MLAVGRFDPYDGKIAAGVDIDDARGADHVHRRRFRQRRLQHIAEHAIDDDVAERCHTLLRRVDVREAEAATVRDMDAANRRGGGDYVVPQTHRLEHALGAARQGGRTVVETRLPGLATRHGLYDGDTQFQRRQGEGEARADHATPGNDDVVARVHRIDHPWPCISASMASGSFASPLLRTSAPLLVTTTSSSMRTPILRKRAGTLRLSGR